MIRLYSPARTERLLDGLSPRLREASERYGVPEACLRAVLYQEMTRMDVLDLPADWLVSLRHRLWRLRRSSPGGRELPPGKFDSSTGYAQIFAGTAIDAIRFACSRGLADPAALGFAERLPDRSSPADLDRVWDRLHRDRDFNLVCCALNLLSAGEEMTGRVDFPGYTPEELKLVFTRYNANVRRITPYGEQVYELYRRYSGAAERAEE
ncbi:MAG: hypothetical protein IJT62_05495 [Oscillospiraceae bacterium]|nr:hypothetical protein [Oscillospiraceae bacterium]